MSDTQVKLCTRDVLMKTLVGFMFGLTLSWYSSLHVTMATRPVAKAHYGGFYRVKPTVKSDGTEVDKKICNASDGSIIEKLNEDVRVLCYISTSQVSLNTKADAIRNTWAKRCNSVLYVSDVTNEKFPAIGFNLPNRKVNSIFKTQKALKYIFQHKFHEADWFLKTDDVTYVIMENLRHFLSDYSPGEPVHVGRSTNKKAASAGFVLSKEALRRYVTTGLGTCNAIDEWTDEFQVAQCMEQLGIPTFEARDYSTQRTRGMDSQAQSSSEYFDRWNAFENIDNTSQYAITFHGIKEDSMVEMEYFVYHLKPYGYANELPNINGPIKPLKVKARRVEKY